MDSIGSFGKPMHALRLPADPSKKSGRQTAHRESEASGVKGGSNSHKRGGGETFMKSEKPWGTGQLSYRYLTFG